MIAVLLIGSLLAALWAERHGSAPARPLIASAALICALTTAEVPFDLFLWVTIDVAVIYAIERTSQVGAAEKAIFALFPPAWVLYHMQPPGWSEAISVIVSLQFLLTVPWNRLEQWVWKARTA